MAARFRSASHATMFGRKKVEGFTDMNEATRYMEGTQLTRALAECMAIIMSEQPADPVERMSELLARWGTAGRENELDLGDVDPKFEVAIVQFKVPGIKNGGTDKGPDGNRIDSIPIANGITKVGGHCDLIEYKPTLHEDFLRIAARYDALVIRINPGHLSRGTPDGTQERFDAGLESLIEKGVLVLPSPLLQQRMGRKDALVRLKGLPCGMEDTHAYHSWAEFSVGLKTTLAHQPRVIKQNRGSCGEGVWLCWLCKADGRECMKSEYPSKQPGEKHLRDSDRLKLMEMSDNHVEYHSVAEFVTFCAEGADGEGVEPAGEVRHAL